MSTVSTIAGATNKVAIGGSVLSLVGATKAFLKPQAIAGISGEVFDLPESESLSLKASITDHYVEDNTAMQDHISIAPKTITLTGKIAELTMTKDALQKYAEQIITKLAAIGIMSAGMSESAQRLLAQYTRTTDAVKQALNQFKDASSIFFDVSAKNKQQQYYEKISGMFYSRLICTVETPWATLENMVIESVNFEQDESTKDWTSVTVSLKQVQFARTNVTSGKIVQGRLEDQKAPIEEKGKGVDRSTLKEGKIQLENYFKGGK